MSWKALLASEDSSRLPSDLKLENTFLFDEIINNRLLETIKSAGQGDYKEM